MPILPAELKMYEAEVMNDTSSNGGRMSSTLIDTEDIANNVFDDVFKVERLAGSLKRRKIFCKQENSAGLILYNTQVWVDILTDGDDWVTIFEGTQTDTQVDIGSPRHYGVAALASGYSAGTDTFTVTVEDESLLAAGSKPILQTGDVVRLTDKDDPLEATEGNEEWLTVDTVTDDTGLDMIVTTTEVSVNAYVLGDRMSSLLEVGNVVATMSDWTPTTSSGTFNQGDNFVVSNIGGIKDEWTLTIKADGISFTVVGTETGALADGTFASDYQIQNPNFSAADYYFTLESAGWGGTWAENDTIVFETQPASVGIWEERTVPLSASSLSDDTTSVAFTGESV